MLYLHTLNFTSIYAIFYIFMNSQPIERQKQIEKLKKMMEYPGRFPILVLGDTGVGKSHWINKLVNGLPEFQNKILSIPAGLTIDTKEYWEDVLIKSDQHFLIIDEVEKLSVKSQELLFKALETNNGDYGFDKKNLKIRIIFTSNFSISKIRDDRRYLLPKFFDRISQFVIEFPNFSETQRDIYSDFEATWNKFFEKTDYFNKCPKSAEFKTWLEAEAYRLHGNFRDLDKIVINWNLHQLSLEGDNKDSEQKILNKIKNDFKKYLHNPSQKIYEDNTFVFDEDSNYNDMLNDFRKKLKHWALAANNNNKHKTANMLKISHRTMENWK